MSDSASELRNVQARAAALRQELSQAARRPNEIKDAHVQAERLVTQARVGKEQAEARLPQLEQSEKNFRKQAADKAKEAEAADLAEKHGRASELREEASVFLSKAQAENQKASNERQNIDKYNRDIEQHTAETQQLQKEMVATHTALGKAEQAVDVLEDKARMLQESADKEAEAADLEAQAAATDDPATAEQLRNDAEGARIVAEATRQNAAELKVDEQAIKDAGLKEPAPAPAPDPDALMDPYADDTASADAAAPVQVAWAASSVHASADDGVGDEDIDAATAGDLSVPAATATTAVTDDASHVTETDAGDYADYAPADQTPMVASYSEADQGQTFDSADTSAEDQQPAPNDASEDTGLAAESEEWTA